MKNKNLKIITNAKQSIWYDNLSKNLLEDGTIKNFIDLGVLGLTSNPSIFKKAIADTNLYDQAIKEMSSLSDDEIALSLMVNDVKSAAILLSKVYQDSNKLDGYASMEVSPLLANDKDGTIKAAKDIWAKINLPNIMIKVPATKAGIEAIEEILYQGINVNVTLIFSLEQYKEVNKAYLRAIKKRVLEGLAVDRLFSVASLFVSRVDNAFKDVEQEIKDELYSKIGLANALSCYEYFLSTKKELPENSNFQRLLWASTSVKDPEFDKLLYVKNLILEDTVNTVPPATLDDIIKLDSLNLRSFTDIYSNYKQTVKIIDNPKFEVSKVMNTLLEDGLNSFKQAYLDILKAVQDKK